MCATSAKQWRCRSSLSAAASSLWKATWTNWVILSVSRAFASTSTPKTLFLRSGLPCTPTATYKRLNHKKARTHTLRKPWHCLKFLECCHGQLKRTLLTTPLIINKRRRSRSPSQLRSTVCRSRRRTCCPKSTRVVLLVVSLLKSNSLLTSLLTVLTVLMVLMVLTVLRERFEILCLSKTKKCSPINSAL